MKIYTTTQTAKLCGVAPRTVCKWIDNGKLEGYRIPASQDRRVTHDALMKFMVEHNLPIPRELAQETTETNTLQGVFSHVVDDDLSNTLFMYFNNVTVQNLAGEEIHVKECALWLHRKEYERVRQYFIDNPKAPS
jgi:excisionase family DNA binding protein